MTNEELVKLIQSGPAPEALEQLYRNNEGFIKNMANRYKAYAEFDDLMQEGFCGLYEAAQHYEGDHETAFLTYAAWWIRQAMKRYIMNCCQSVRIPEHTAGTIWQYRRFIQQYCQYYGHEPSRTVIQRFLCVDDKTFERIEKAAYSANIQSLDESLKMDEELTLGDTVSSGEDMEAVVIESMTAYELKKELWGIVDTLEGQQPEVIRRRYQSDQALKTIGEGMGISSECVRQIERDAMRKLRLPKNTRRLRPFLPEVQGLTDQERAMSYHGNGVQYFKQTWTSTPERVALRRLGCT